MLNDPVNGIDPLGLEVWYKDGVTKPTDTKLLKILKKIDETYPGYNVRVSGGIRSPSHADCTKERPSQHCSGKAADIKVTKGCKDNYNDESKEKDYFIDSKEIADLAKELGATGTIYKPYLNTFKHTHIDTRTGYPYHPR